MVTDDFNPYHEWLGLDSQLKQPNYYQLLGVEPGETNALMISTSAERAAARVRSIRPGPRAAEWAKVLDEIASAKNCLMDPTRRAQYDRQLAAVRPGTTGGYRRPAPRDKTATAQPGAGQPNTYTTGVPMSAPTVTPVQPSTAPMPTAPAATPYPTAAQPMAPAAGPQMPHGQATYPGVAPGYAAPMAPGTPYPAYQTPGSPVMPTPGAAPTAGTPMAAPQAYPSGPLQPSPSGPMPAGPTTAPQTPSAGMAPHAAGPAAGSVAPLAGHAAGQYGSTPAANPTNGNLPTGVPLGSGATTVASTPASTSPGVKTGSERSASRMVRKRADRSKQVPMLAAVLGGAILLVAIVLLAVLGGGGGDDGKKGTGQRRSTYSRPAAQRPIASPRRSGRPSKLPRFRPTVTGPVTETPRKGSELPQAPVVDPPPETPPAPTELQPEQPSKPPVTKLPSDPTVASPKSKTELPPEIKPVPKPTAQPQPAEVATLATALKSARAKLESNDFDGASAELKKVRSLPKLPEHQAKHERLRLLTEYASRFHSSLLEALKNLEAGDEISAGANAAAGVVNVTADRIVLRIDGENRTYVINDLPPGLAVAIADTWLDQNDPVCLLAKAAYLAALKDARDDRLAKAREWFQEASKSGVDIGDLEKVIDDKYDDLEKDLAP
ncbi:MAG: hypothetical protein H8E44_28645 [Planctomycetes bacterium]|nr:hypothetical protein [Planctomycetota bacterium]MBL7039269.1 hypothetical protein [Pirellulaceae bacterium]